MFMHKSRVISSDAQRGTCMRIKYPRGFMKLSYNKEARERNDDRCI